MFHNDLKTDQELLGGCGQHMLKTPGRDPEASGGPGPFPWEHDPWENRHSCAVVLVLVGLPQSSLQHP